VILQEFNYDLRPSDVTFDELAIWVNILNLPFELRDEKWGFELANDFMSSPRRLGGFPSEASHPPRLPRVWHRLAASRG